MAKIAIVIFILCILAFATISPSHAKEEFDVEGDVYCDPCRVQFQTRLSHKLEGVTVKLECIDPIKENVNYSVEGVTDSNGHYKLTVDGDHEDNICEVTLVKSPEAECAEPMSGLETARIVATENMGIHSDVRYANPLGFMSKEPMEGCKEVLEELGLTPQDLGITFN